MSTGAFPSDYDIIINRVIDNYFQQALAEAKTVDPDYLRLWQTLSNLVQAGGKRLRPKMTLLAFEAFGGMKSTHITPVAVAQEFLHICLLIQDDIIDRDYVRHGAPNVAGQYQSLYQKYLLDPKERTHFAHGAALLGSDLMLAAAYELIASSGLKDEQLRIAHSFLTKSTFSVAGGELLDTEACFTPHAKDHAIKIALYKTANYSFVYPLLTGATLAGIDNQQRQILREFGTTLGTAYQLVDDLLGVFGSEEATGKSTFSDIREGKRTYLVEQAIHHMSASDQQLFNVAFGNPQASITEVAQTKALLITSGAQATVQDLIEDYKNQALRLIPQLHLAPDYEQKFEALVYIATERSA